MPKSMSYSSNHKSSLKLMELPENGHVHEYGEPVLKSVNPCTVKQVASMNKNAKWVSPDKNFSSKAETLPKKSTKKAKASTRKPKNENSSPSVQSGLKSRNRRYPQLAFVESGTEFTNDDNKENIKPGETKSVPPSHVRSTKEQTRFQFAGSSHRTNLI